MRHYKVLHPDKPIAITDLFGGERWSPEYFRPEYVENERMLGQRSDIHKLGSLVKRLTCGPFGSSVPSSLFQDTGIPFVRMSNVRPFLLDTSNLVFLRDYEADRLSAANFKPGDVLLSKTGKTGLATILPDGSDRYVISQDVVGIELRQAIPGYFIVAFLNSRFGELQFRRIEKGNVQAHLDLTTTREVLVPLPDRLIQDYIGAKIELAERCRKMARALDKTCQDALLGSLRTSGDLDTFERALQGTYSKDEKFRAYSVGSDGFAITLAPTLIRERLDPDGYHPLLLMLREQSNKTSLLKPLHSLAQNQSSSRRRLAANDVEAFVSVLHVDDEGYVDLDSAQNHSPESNGIRCFGRDLLVSCINPTANRIAILETKQKTTACSAEFAALTTDQIHQHYLAFALRSEICRQQLIHLGKGTSSSRRRIGDEELMDCLVPVVQESDHLGELMRKRQLLVRKAFRLVAEAKSDIEALIEGTIDADAILTGKLKPPTWEKITETIDKED